MDEFSDVCKYLVNIISTGCGPILGGHCSGLLVVYQDPNNLSLLLGIYYTLVFVGVLIS